jgi:hypothetical protein
MAPRPRAGGHVRAPLRSSRQPLITGSDDAERSEYWRDDDSASKQQVSACPDSIQHVLTVASGGRRAFVDLMNV